MTNLRNPRQASSTFDLGGSQAPRPRGLFVVHFRRAEYSEGTPFWQRDLSFLVKSIEQPTVNPKVEELNQYNKKRQIYTGYTTNPVNCVLFDTADGMALRMWNDYVRYYFADFNQNEENFHYDVTSEGEMKGTDIGFGFSPRMDKGDVLDGNSQFFFAGIDIYQVFRNAYTKTTLVNPRISAFDPDDFDYEQMAASTYRMTFAYEAVLYANQGAPQSLDGEPELASLFEDIRLHGDVIEVSGPAPAPLPTIGSASGSSVGQSPLGGLTGILGNNGVSSVLSSGLGLTQQRGGLGGVLGAAGNFNFGNGLATAVGALVGGNKQNLASQLTYATTGSAQLGTLVNMVTTKQPASALLGQVLNGAARSGSLDPNLYSAAVSAIALKQGNKLAAGSFAENAVRGILGGAIVNGGTPINQVTKSNVGIRLSTEAMSFVNSVSKPLTKIGFKLPKF